MQPVHRAPPVQTPAMAWAVLVLVLGLVAPLTPPGPQPLIQPATAQSLRTVVLSIGDGDTIRVRQGGRAFTVRLACIDAPETAQSPHGVASRRYLQQRLRIGQEVMLHPKTTDRYGRTVAEVISDININLVMVEDGQAFAYRRYLAACAAREYLDAEYRASRHRYGVWQVEGGITRPWDFRRGLGTAVIPDGTTPGGHRYRCRQIGSYARAQQLLREGHTYLDGNGDGQACESLR
jgi:endonuclease YncB( thermonuclease family)